MNKNLLNSFIKDQSGQSLMEIIVGLSIGAILIGTASFGIAFMLRSTTTNQNLGNASQITQGLLNNIQTFAGSNWQNIYGLSKSSSTQYFLNASGTSYITVQGQEGVIDNDVTNGLVGEWKLDEASGTIAYDTIGSGHNSTLFNSPAFTTSTCKISGCFGFTTSTNTYVAYTGGGFLPTGSSTRTITFWFNPGSGMTTANIAVGYGCSNTEGNGCSSQGVGTYVGAWANTSNMGLHLETCQVTGINTPTPAASWHLYTAVFNGGNTITFYIDGKTPTTVTAPCTVNSASGKGISIGVGRWGYYSGYLDDIRIYNRALSASEVTQLYNSQTFSRYFYVDNVCRTNDSSGNIASSSAPCSGGATDDPLTQKVTAIAQWTFGAGTDQVSLSRYITRWGNFSIRQTDWSGGSGQDGPLTAPNNQYSSSTNIAPTSTLGSFQINNLTQ